MLVYEFCIHVEIVWFQGSRQLWAKGCARSSIVSCYHKPAIDVTKFSLPNAFFLMELGKNIPGAAQIWVNLDLFLNTNVAIFSLTSNTFHLQDNLCFDLLISVI